MDQSERDAREKQIFHVASSIDELQARKDFLVAECGTDEGLLNRVNSLLLAADVAGDFLEKPLVNSEPDVGASRVEEPVARQIGRYELLEKIGEGGFGVVYMADQTEPIRRRVALKIIKAGMDSKQVIARFESERQALALMDHPNIAKVLDAGTTEKSRPYFVMELVRGTPVTDYCDERRMSTKQRLGVFLQLCSAIQHAHQKGIIHRDIKPTNILVTTNGDVPVTKVIDFGIAKATQGQLTDKTLFTHYRQFVGTPAYMSPEQAQMSATDIDVRSDIYSLGVLLYELFTGTTPLDSKQLNDIGFDELCRHIREDEAPRPSKRVSTLRQGELNTIAKKRGIDPAQFLANVRGDLDWIVVKAVEKDRTRRYASVDALAHDVQRYLDEEPVSAVPPNTLYVTRRLARKHRRMLRVIGAVAAALVVGTIVSVWQAGRARQAERAVNYHLYVSEMAMAKREFDLYNTQNALRIIERYVPEIATAELRGFEWRWMWNQCHQERFQLIGHAARLRSLSFSRDGRWLATGSRDGTVRLWDMETRQQVWQHRGGDDCNYVEFLSNGKGFTARFWTPPNRFLSISWDISDPANPRVLQPVVLRPPGNEETTTTSSNAAKRDDYRKESEPAIGFKSPGATISPDRNVSVTRNDRWARVWSRQNKLVATLEGTHDTPIGNTEFSRQGNWLAVRHELGAIRVFDTTTWNEALSLRLPSGVSLAFSPQDDLLVAGGDDGIVRGWKVDPTLAADAILDHPAAVLNLKFSPNGSTLAVGMTNGAVQFWDVARRAKLFDIPPQSEEDPWKGRYNAYHFDFIAFSPNSQAVAVIGPRDTVSIWNVNRGKKLAVLAVGDDYPKEIRRAYWSLEFSGDGTRLYTGLCLGNSVGVVESWEWVNGVPTMLQRLQKQETPGIWHRCMAKSPDGRLLATTSFSTTHGAQCSIWKLPELVLVNELKVVDLNVNEHDSKFQSVAFSHDGSQLAITVDPPAVTLWDTATWRLTAELPHSMAPEFVTWSPDGTRLASSDRLGNSKLWDTKTRRVVSTFRGANVAFSPDGTTLAVGCLGSKHSGARSLSGRVILHFAPPLQEIDQRRNAMNEAKQDSP